MEGVTIWFSSRDKVVPHYRKNEHWRMLSPLNIEFHQASEQAVVAGWRLFLGDNETPRLLVRTGCSPASSLQQSSDRSRVHRLRAESPPALPFGDQFVNRIFKDG